MFDSKGVFSNKLISNFIYITVFENFHAFGRNKENATQCCSLYFHGIAAILEKLLAKISELHLEDEPDHESKYLTSKKEEQVFKHITENGAIQ